VLGSELLHPFLHSFSHGLDKPRMNRPAVHDALLEGIRQSGSGGGPPEFIKA
jgi:hypothetical protein